MVTSGYRSENVKKSGQGRYYISGGRRRGAYPASYNGKILGWNQSKRLPLDSLSSAPQRRRCDFQQTRH